ncbi:fusaric acid resistance protein, partial [Burkholderia gladioli]
AAGWQAVIADFVERRSPCGLRLSLNPALMQALPPAAAPGAPRT